MNIYSYDDYRDLITTLLQVKHGRGSKVKLAGILNCQPGYISQVLTKSKIHFSPENIIRISEFLELDVSQSDYLLTLLHKEKAGSENLKDFYETKLKKAKEEHLKVERQVQPNLELSGEVKAIYYSHWAYCAVHMLVSIEAYQKSELIAKKLKLNQDFAQKILNFLEEKSLIVKTGARYTVGKTRLHLQSSSPLIKSHHQNFRHKAITSLDEENQFNLHYSSVMTLSKKDALLIREQVLKLVASNDKILIPSENEDIICLNLDLFKI